VLELRIDPERHVHEFVVQRVRIRTSMKQFELPGTCEYVLNLRADDPDEVVASRLIASQLVPYRLLERRRNLSNAHVPQIS
jgi:hypothetical protein